MISKASVRRAIDHLGSFGDTDLFPPYGQEIETVEKTVSCPVLA